MRWSHSTDKTMRQCHRQLVYSQVVASHGRRNPWRHEIFVLKQLQTPNAWQGKLLHQVLEARLFPALSRRQPIRWDSIIAAAHDLARRQFAFSAARRYRAGDVSKSLLPEYLALAGHETDAGVPASVLDEVHDAVDRALGYLARNAKLVSYLQKGSSHRAEHQLHFRLPMLEVALTATVDLLFFRGVNEVTILDWKFGRSDTADYSRQLHVYALALLRSGSFPTVDLHGIHLVEANLLQGEVRRHPIDEEQLDEVEDFVFRSASRLKELIGDCDGDTVDVSAFSVARNARNCSYCPFRGPCRVAADTARHAALGASEQQTSLFGELEAEGELVS